MTNLIPVLILILAAFQEPVSGNEWTWLSGSTQSGSSGSYGTLGVPSPDNSPPSRSYATMWLVSSTRTLYMFSGSYDGWWSDMWQFSIDQSVWTWIAGQSFRGFNDGVFAGGLGEFKSNNRPPSRTQTCSFIYRNELYVYGGTVFSFVLGQDSNLGDVWKFNTTLIQWAWVGGTSTMNHPGSYGNLRIANSSNVPPSRRAANCWEPVGDLLYLFNGASTVPLHDMWALNLTNFVWTWIHGSSTPDQSELYVTLGTPSPLNFPGRQASASGWRGGNFLYMGFGAYDDSFWKFDLETWEWTCLVPQSSGYLTVRGSLGAFNSVFYPGGRSPCASWTSSQGNLMLYGGTSAQGRMSDVWEYSVELEQWRWVTGPTTANEFGNFGQIGQSSVNNTPPGGNYIGFAANSQYPDTLFVFGGEASSPWLTDVVDVFNYLWKFTTCSSKVSSDGSVIDCHGCKYGQYFLPESLTCMNCTEGRFSDISGSTSFSSCSLCALGKYSDGMSSACDDCEPGKFGNSDDFSIWCQECLQGTYAQHSGHLECDLCDPGRFASSNGSSSCSYCRVGTYQDEPGSSQCQSCLPNAITFLLGSESVSACACKEGFWGRAYENQPCFSCSGLGGISCPPNSSVPLVLPGFFRDPLAPELAYPCIPGTSCASTDYNMQTQCSTGYEGYLCGSCSKMKYFRRGLECIECSSIVSTVIVGIIVALILVLIAYRVLQTNFQLPVDLRISIYWMQMISLYPSLSETWPASLRTFFHITSLSNMNIELVSPECSVEISFLQKTLISLLLPFICAGALIIAYLFKILWNRFQQKPSSSSNMPSTQRVVAVSLFITAAFFTNLISSSSSVLNCQGNETRKVVATAPSLECYSTEWRKILGISAFFLFLYALVFPAMLAGLFLKYKRSPNPSITTILQNFIRPYQEQYFYWELIDLLRKLVFVILNDFIIASGTHFTKIFVTVCFLFAVLIIEVILRPYRTEDLNRKNFLWNITAIVILLSDGLVFHVNEISSQDKEIFSAFMIILVLISLIYSLLSAALKSSFCKHRLKVKGETESAKIGANQVHPIYTVEPHPQQSSLETNIIPS